MSFIKRDILPKIIGIIDVGSYKVRVAICKYKNNNLTLIGYGEKRQDSSCFVNGECGNIELLTENLDIAIKKAEKSAGKKVKKIAINFPFSNLFFSSKKINYKRKDKNLPISKKELETILEKSGNIVLKRTLDNIKKISGLESEELKLIVGNIININIDKIDKKSILNQTGENISLSFNNIFIPLNKYNVINYIGNIINKKIIKIIPSEYSIAKVFKEKNLVIVNIGASSTYITIKKEGNIIGISKIEIGINDLINLILKKIKDTRVNIINNLNNNIYLNEKKQFIDIWGESLIIGINEIIKDKICPSDFVILGGGKNNFVKDFFLTGSVIGKSLKLVKNIKLINFDNSELKNHVENYDFILNKIRLDSLSLMMEVNNFINKERDIMSEILKKAITKLGFYNN